MILPIVKKQTAQHGICALPHKITYAFDSELAQIGASAFADFVCGAEYAKAGAFVTFSLDDTLEARDEIYRVTVAADAIKVGFRDARGAVNGAATVALLLRKKEIPCQEIVDYPDFGYRSFLLDFARGVPTEEDIFSTLRAMALAKYNRVHLHLIDAYGPCYESDALPELRLEERKGKPCKKDLLKRIAKVCEQYAIEIIPELEIPAHSLAITNAHPEFQCLAEGASGWAICPGNDDVWQFYTVLLEEFIEIFPNSEFIHIGTDEVDCRDFSPKYHCYWDRCPRCAALRAREGLADVRAEFYYVVNRMFEIVKAHGKKMMMWNDQIDISRDVPLSREILIHFWRIAAPQRGPVDGCTMEGFLEKGFCVINSYYPYTYTDQYNYISPEKMKTWNACKAPSRDFLPSEPILGGEGCAWEFGNYKDFPFLSYVIPAVLPILGDKLWDASPREHTEDYRKALSEFLFGTDEFTCIFDVVGDIMPPKKADVFIAPTADPPTQKAVSACLAKLKAVNNQNCLVTAKHYIGLFEKIKAQIEENQ